MMRIRRTLTIAAIVGALVVTAGAAFAAGATSSQDDTLLRNPVDAMSTAMNGWHEPHADPASMHRESATPLEEADRDALRRDVEAHRHRADHDALHAQMRGHMPTELREDCDAHHDEGARPGA